jgi:hypothetical protein
MSALGYLQHMLSEVERQAKREDWNNEQANAAMLAAREEYDVRLAPLEQDPDAPDLYTIEWQVAPGRRWRPLIEDGKQAELSWDRAREFAAEVRAKGGNARIHRCSSVKYLIKSTLTNSRTGALPPKTPAQPNNNKDDSTP